MSDQVQFYYNPMSRARIVHWMLEEVNADYKIHNINFEKGDQKSPDFLALNPMGKLPTIVHKGVVVTETAAICAYLADAFPEANMAPELDDPRRGTYYRWLFFAATCIEPAILDKRFPRKDGPNQGFLGWGHYNDVMSTVETAISDGFILGSDFSAADVYMASQIRWGLYNKDIEPKPIFKDYCHRCEDRPAFKAYMSQAGSFEHIKNGVKPKDKI